MELIYHQGALADIEDAVAFYEAQREGLGRTFREQLERVETLVAAKPEAWPIVRGRWRRALFKRFPYSFLYTVRPDLIFVAAIAHQRRKPDYWHKRVSVD